MPSRHDQPSPGGAPGPQAAPPILTVPEELAAVEPVALTGNFWVSLPDLDPATGAARSVGLLSEAARALIEFTGAPVTRDPAGPRDGGSGPLLVPIIEWQGRQIWPPEPAAGRGSPESLPAANGESPERPRPPGLHYLAGWIPRWSIPLPGLDGWNLELTWLAPVDQRGFAVRARLVAHPAAPPAARGAFHAEAAGGTGAGRDGPAEPQRAGGGRPASALAALRAAAQGPVPQGLRLGLLVRPGAVFRTVYHRRPLPGDPGPYPHRWTRTLVWEAPGPVPLGALALRSATGDEPAAGPTPGTWVFWAPPGDGELVVYGGVAPEGDGAGTTAVHLARVGWEALFATTLAWLAGRDPFRAEDAPRPGQGLEALQGGGPVPPATPYAPADPGPSRPAVDPAPGGDRDRATWRRAGLARAVAAGLLNEAEAGELAERLRRNLWFAVFFAHGRTVDGDGWVHLTSRSPRYYVSGAHWTRDSLLWAFPAVLAADPRLARQLLVAAFARYTRYPGEHSQYLDGTVLYPGWELDQAAAWPLSLARYLEATGDASILDEPAVARGLAAALQAAEARRDPATGLIATFLLPSDDPAQRPFVTYDNALYAQGLDDLAAALGRLIPRRPASWAVRPHGPAGEPGEAAGYGRPGPQAAFDPAELAERARLTRQAVLAHCVAEGPWGPQFAWAVAGPGGAGAVLYDEPPGTLELLGPYGFARRRPGDGIDVEAVYANTVRWIYSAHNPYGPPPGPFRTPVCPHARHPWLLSVAAGLLAGRRDYLGWLARAPMDSGFACETVDAATGIARTGPAFATCAGFVAWAALTALESLGREAGGA